MFQDYTRRDPENPDREPRYDDDPDDWQVDEQHEHPAVEEERRRLRRAGVYI